MQHNLDLLRVAVERHLKSKSCLPVKVLFRLDVYRFLFRSEMPSNNAYFSLNRDDLTSSYFPSGWDALEDSHGQGIKVFFPMKMKTFLSWSPKKYIGGSNGIPSLCPRAFEENMSFSFTKVALGDLSM